MIAHAKAIKIFAANSNPAVAEKIAGHIGLTLGRCEISTFSDGGISVSIGESVRGADVFVGVSAGGVLSQEMVRSMADDAIVFACANPTPEIMPDLALAVGAKIVATGRSDFPNQINNLLAFPGVFRGALDVRAKDITLEMNLAASRAISALVTDEELCADYIIPAALDKRVAMAVADAVASACI